MTEPRPGRTTITISEIARERLRVIERRLTTEKGRTITAMEVLDYLLDIEAASRKAIAS